MKGALDEAAAAITNLTNTVNNADNVSGALAEVGVRSC